MDRRKRLVAPILAASAFVLAFIAGCVAIRLLADQSVVTWLGRLPVWLTFVAMVAFWCLFALIAWWLSERLFEEKDREVTHENVARLLLVMTSFFVFVLGFVVAQEWSNLTSARNHVSQGAAAVYTAGYLADPLPKKAAQDIKASLAELGQSVTCDDLPALRETGRGSPETAAALADTFKVITDQPRPVRDEPTFGNIVDEVSAISEARSEWLAEAAAGLPTVLLATILIVSACLLAAFVVQSTRSRKGHLVTALGLALLVALGTGLVISLSRPFGGAAQIPASTFQQGPYSVTDDCSKPPAIPELPSGASSQ